MKNLIIAAAMAAASVLTVAGPSQAASVTVTTQDGGPRMMRESHRPRVYNTEYHRPRHGCVVKKTRIHRNGHWVVRTSKVCR